jgi:hypothetical protein
MNYVAYCQALVELHNEGHLNGKRKFKQFNREFDVTTWDGVKKLIKAIYKKEINPTYKERKPKCLINEWVRYSEDGESKMYVGIFKKTPRTEEALSYYIDFDEDNNYYDYSPTGLWFGSRAEVTELEDRIIVQKSWHLDC